MEQMERVAPISSPHTVRCEVCVESALFRCGFIPLLVGSLLLFPGVVWSIVLWSSPQTYWSNVLSNDVEDHVCCILSTNTGQFECLSPNSTVNQNDTCPSHSVERICPIGSLADRETSSGVGMALLAVFNFLEFIWFLFVLIGYFLVLDELLLYGCGAIERCVVARKKKAGRKRRRRRLSERTCSRLCCFQSDAGEGSELSWCTWICCLSCSCCLPMLAVGISMAVYLSEGLQNHRLPPTPGVDFSCSNLYNALHQSCGNSTAEFISFETISLISDLGICVGSQSWYSLFGLEVTLHSLIALGFCWFCCGTCYSLNCRNRRELLRCNASRECYAVLEEGFKIDSDALVELLDHEFTKCYCYQCLTNRDETRTAKRVNGMRSSVPRGWVRFGIRVSSADVSRGVFSQWWKAYHGTSCFSAAAILKSGGDLLMPGDTLLSGKKLPLPPGHIDNATQRRRLYASPSILYASSPDYYATPFRIEDEESTVGKQYQVVFEVRVKPRTEEDECFVIEQDTLPYAGQIDPNFENEELEWATPRRGVMVLTGVLLRRFGRLEPDERRLMDSVEVEFAGWDEDVRRQQIPSREAVNTVSEDTALLQKIRLNVAEEN